ncbi:MAG: sulfatase [Candidatus Firestonebacteria bacterium RIFOXYA2_FULL_40_8]|nr:MAG: sulfatase [Candidatus Firestonebacteria bacterium RIFOXYA2_FULL_40_8]
MKSILKKNVTNSQRKRPNIILILIDDLGWKDLSVYGSGFYETPNLDKLAGEGVMFTNAYSSCPVCSPTRASIMTGKYPATVGITQFIGGRAEGKLKDVQYLDHLPLSEYSVAKALKKAGYKTWHIGKWHLGSEPYYPEHHGFDVNISGCHWGMPKNGYFSPYGIPNFTDGSDGEYLTDRLTNEAIKLMEQNDGKPFFLNLCHYAVHIPIQAPESLIDKYVKKVKKLGFDKKAAFVEGESMPCRHLAGKKVTRRLFQSDPVYAAMIENLDWNIGRMLDVVNKKGMKDDTLVIFTSDNGGLSTAEGSPTCNYPLSEGKGWMREGGNRVCQIIRWPRVVKPAGICKTNVVSTDFYPTFLEAAGLPLIPKQHCDGVSLMPLLRGEKNIDRQYIFWHYPHYSNQGGTPAAAVLDGKWKLIKYFEDNHIELYNIENDLGENTNLYEREIKIAKRLHSALVKWQKSIEAKIPEQNTEYPEHKEERESPYI